ncbi:hypothetical protein K440DRAFT_474306, partial [Wilcoxina mikolae CBS 423.85]
RTSKACEECRKRKIKCTGKSPVPCEYCRLKRLNCVYRSQARTRRRPNLLMRPPPARNIAQVFDPLGGGRDVDLAVGDVVGSPIEESVYAGVSATYADSPSPSRTLQLYYGPSSNFPMIQHINQRLRKSESTPSGDTPATTATTATTATDPSPIEEVDEGLDRFQYRPIFFSKYSDQQDSPYPGGVGGGVGDGTGKAAGRIDDSNLLFLSYNLASDFLNKFLMTLQRHLPFVDPASAEELLAILYGNFEARELDIGERAILLAVLAIGATLTEHAMTWGETLYRRARAVADELDDVVNVHVCQLGLLLGHYNSICGKPNSVYLLIGTAMRKALAAGLHKEALSQSRQSVDFALVQERRLTFWSIYIFEVTICYGLGRPISINDNDINIPYPEDQPFFLTLVTLSRIYSRASRQLYGTKQGSLLNLWKVARGLKAELDAFRTSLPEELQIGPDAPPQPGTYEVLRLFLNNWYYHAMILTFRPFLIFHAQWQKDHRLSVSDNPDRVEISYRQLKDRAPWIFEACGYCVQAAREQMICLSKAVESNDLVRRLAYNCFYIEGGTFLLIFNMLRDRKTMAEDAACVRMALKAMDMMYPNAPRDISEFAIKRML